MTTLAQLLADLNRLGVSLSPDGDELLVKAPADALTAEHREALRGHKPEILSLLRTAGPQPPALPQSPAARLPLSHAQQRIWFLSQLEPGSAVWNVASVFSLTGSLNVGALERSLSEIVSRHSVLRSTFHSRDGIPFARLTSPLDWSLVRRVAAPADALAEARAAAIDPFDLTTGPLFRAVLFEVPEISAVSEASEASADTHFLSLAIHHIVCDGWSLGILSRELSLLYNAFALGHTSPLPPPETQYTRYVDWERAALEQASQADIAWWQQKLAPPLPALELGIYRRPLPVPRHVGRRISLAVPSADAARFHQLARECNVTPFMLLLAAFKVLLFRSTGVEDIVIGTASSYRKRREFEQVVGMFANPVVLRTSLAGNPPFRHALDRTRDTVMAAFSHDTLPFDRLIEELHPARESGAAPNRDASPDASPDASRAPLFQVSFAYQNLPPAALHLDGIGVAHLPVEIPSARHDLSVEIWTTASGMVFDFEFRTALFDVPAIERMQARFLQLLCSAVADPDTLISDLAWLPAPERAMLAAASQGAASAYPQQPVHILFEEQSRLTPGAPALIDGPRFLTYRELNAQADHLCARLHARGVRAGTTVAILIDRSAASICAMLAILKAGGIYLVLDTDYPDERLRFLLQDADAKLVLVNSTDSIPEAQKLAGVDCLDIAHLLEPSSADPLPLPARTSLDSPMCLLYTSGSTGTPKGVEICHRGLVRLLFSRECQSFGSGEAVLHLAPESFDASLLEIWAPLVHGGCSVICRDRHPDPLALKALIEANRVRAAWFTSSLFNWIVDQEPATFASLERIYTGGEALSLPHVRRAYEALPGVTLFNGYGPTEATVFTCLYAIPRDLPMDLASIPIGRPLSNTSAWVLDANRQPVPVGVPGELYIGGDALALGYRNRQPLNAERFIPNPFADPFPIPFADRGKLYRSGDRCVRLPDGNLQFIGRLDSQIKIRGHRVEPGEIEAALARHPDLSACAVTLRRDPQRGDTILAWFAGPSSLQPDSLRAMLKTILPSYMVPSLFLRLDALPLLQNGKIDRAALSGLPIPADPTSAFPAAPSDLPPRPDTGFGRDVVPLIAQAMAELLGIKHVRHDEDFFALGGNSLLAMQLIARIEALLGRRISPALLFQSATPDTIARFLAEDSILRPKRLLPLRSPLPSLADFAPLFCLHLLLDGSIHDYLALVRALGESLPVYGICPGQFDLTRTWTLPQIAAEYLAEIKRVRPSGPYHLCGYSSAGMLAFEMARQLTLAGDHVNLFLLDSFPPANFRSLSALELFKLARLFVRSRGRQEIAMRLVRRASRHVRQSVTNFVRRAITSHVPPVEDQEGLLLTMLNRAMKTYRSRIYSGKAILFKAQQQDRHHKYNFDGLNNWERLVRGGVDLRHVPGNHRQIMQPPSVDLIASQLLQSLQQKSPAGTPAAAAPPVESMVQV